jgi:hypothetical protein
MEQEASSIQRRFLPLVAGATSRGPRCEQQTPLVLHLPSLPGGAREAAKGGSSSVLRRAVEECQWGQPCVQSTALHAVVLVAKGGSSVCTTYE